MERDELYHYSSISLPIHLSTFISINLPPCRVSINLSICRSFYLLTCLSVSISIYSHLSIILYLFRNLLSNLCIYITKHLSIHLFIYVFVCFLFIYLSINLSVLPCASIYVCFFIYIYLPNLQYLLIYSCMSVSPSISKSLPVNLSIVVMKL